MWGSINEKENQCEHAWMSELLLGLVSFYFYWTPHMWFENRIKEKQFKKNDHDV